MFCFMVAWGAPKGQHEIQVMCGHTVVGCGPIEQTQRTEGQSKGGRASSRMLLWFAHCHGRVPLGWNILKNVMAFAIGCTLPAKSGRK